MGVNAGVVMSNLIGLFILIAVGYVAVQTKTLSLHLSAPLSRALLQIFLPCTIFVSLVTQKFHMAFLKDYLIIIAMGFVLFPAGMLFSLLLAGILKVADGGRGIWAFGATYSNNGFMGFPIVLSLLGPEALSLAVIFALPFNVIVYSLGVKLICLDSQGKAGCINWKRVFVSNINIAIALSLIFYIGGISLPRWVMIPLNHLSSVTTSLSMIVTGMALTKGNVSDLLKSRDVYTCTAVRLLLYPLLLILLMKILPFDPLVESTIVIILAMPAPSITAVLAETYHANMKLAANIVFLTSLFCIITIPVITILL